MWTVPTKHVEFGASPELARWFQPGRQVRDMVGSGGQSRAPRVGRRRSNGRCLQTPAFAL